MPDNLFSLISLNVNQKMISFINIKKEPQLNSVELNCGRVGWAVALLSSAEAISSVIDPIKSLNSFLWHLQSSLFYPYLIHYIISGI